MRCDCRGSRFIKKGFGLVYQYQDGYAHRDYDSSVAKSSLYPLPVVPAWGKGLLRDGFRRHLLGWYSARHAVHNFMCTVFFTQERGMDEPAEQRPPAHDSAAARRHGFIHWFRDPPSLDTRK